ncbi:MAG TPA: hypothetical protein VG940_01040 [Gemmatimonadales bacterium]|nr:hypothetical protein [Gemmatimonadales bacterium]
MPRHSARLFLAAPLLLVGVGVAGCGHTEIGSFTPVVQDTAFLAGEPLRLTYSDGRDRTPGWSTATGRIVYAFDNSYTSRNLPKGCVGDLPLSGGSREWELCDTDAQRVDTSTVGLWPALRSDGAVALVRQRWPLIGLAPYYSDLAVRPPSPSALPVKVLPIPYFSGGRSHQGVAYLQWLDDTRLVWLGQGVIRSTLDNVESGYDINILDLVDTAAGITVVPGTDYASSVARGGNADTLYYTLGGDSLVYRRTLSTGAVDTVYDFGALRIARDVQVKNGRLTAVVGGSVSWGPHATLGMAQYDNGGPVYAVDLPAGAPVLVTQTYDLYRHPVLSPDGAFVVAEQFNDLWRIALP